MDKQESKQPSIQDEGWDGLDAKPQQDIVPNEVDLLYQRVFSTDDGTKLLNHLSHFTLNQPCWQPGDSKSKGAYREGQNSVIREIMARMIRATREVK